MTGPHSSSTDSADSSNGPLSAEPVNDDQVTGQPELPAGWTAGAGRPEDADELTELLRRHEEAARGWASAGREQVLAELTPPGSLSRLGVVVRDGEGRVRGWGSAHDRAAGRVLLAVVVDPRLDDPPAGGVDPAADAAASWLFAWADRSARDIAAQRGLEVQQIDSGAFAGDDRQHRWLRAAGYEQVRTWWQMTRPVAPGDASLDPGTKKGVRIRRVARTGAGMPDEDDLRTVHDVLESAFADHFNSHEETFDEFVSRLREDPGHRWDHWWVAELLDGPGGEDQPEPAGALVGSVTDGGSAGTASYVEYIGVLQSARGRGVATSLLHTVVADAADRGRSSVGLEVDASSPTGADGLYVSLGWTTGYVTESWHRSIAVTGGAPRGAGDRGL